MPKTTKRAEAVAEFVRRWGRVPVWRTSREGHKLVAMNEAIDAGLVRAEVRDGTEVWLIDPNEERTDNG